MVWPSSWNVTDIGVALRIFEFSKIET